jgi:pilus assembly protein CpaD
MKKPLYLLAVPVFLALAACRPGSAEYTEAESPKLLRVDGNHRVTLPPCPNWSQYPTSDFTNVKSSNFGCAMATNLGLMVANPADLAAGRELAAADATPAVSGVTRYLTDKVKLPDTGAGAAALAPASAGGGAPTGGAGTPTGSP